MLRIIYSRTGARGGTGELFKKALLLNGNTGPDFSGIVYLTPSHFKLKSAYTIFHSLFSGLSPKGTYVPPLMATPSQLSKRLCQSHSDSLLLPSYLRAPVLARLSGMKGRPSGINYSILLSDLLKELKSQFPGLSPETFSQEVLKSAVNELGIPSEVAERLENALEIFDLYDSTLRERNFIDETDSFFAARDLTGPLGDKIVLLDGFFELRPAEKLLIAPLLGSARETLALVPFDEKYSEITEDLLGFLKGFEHQESGLQGKEDRTLAYYIYPSREEEIESIARKIKAACLSKGVDSVLPNTCILFPDGPEYSNMAERVFLNYGIPCSFRSNKSMEAIRAGDLLSLLEAARDGGAKELARIISSPLFKEIPEKLARWGPKITLKAIPEGAPDELLSLPDAPKEELKWLKKKLSGLKKVSLQKETTFSKVVKAYLETLRGLGFALEGTGKNFAEKLEESLKGLYFLDLLPGRSGPQEFIESLQYVIASVREEDEEPGALISPFTEASAFLEPDSLYFAGLRDGAIPARPELDFFLPERLRTRLGLRTMKSHLFIEEFLFKRLISSAKNVHLSFPEMEGDKVFIPSVLISEGEVLKEPVYGIFSREEELLRKGRSKRPLSGSVREIKVKYKGKKTLRVTDIDRYRACPRLFFLENILGLSPSEAERYELEPRTAGTLLHSVMEKLCPIREDDIQSLTERAGKVLDDVLSAEDIFLDPFWKELLKANFLSSLPDILQIEQDFRKNGYGFHEAELKLEGTLRGIKFKGKIDRMDKNNEGSCQILDYKTGRIELNGKDVLEKGATLQLFLYAALAAQKGLVSTRVGLYSLKDLKVKFIPGRSDIKAGRELKHYVASSLSYLTETSELINKGDFPARPLSDQSCRRCPEKPYCPFIHADSSVKEKNNSGKNGN